METINCFELTTIKNSKLPSEWQDSEALDGFSNFLQKNWEQRAALFNDGQTSGRQQFIEFTANSGIKTQNYIGTIIYKGNKLNIFPKVFREDIDDNDTSDLDIKHLMKNIVQWLDYCKKIDYPFININNALDNSEDLRDLFVTLYIRYVKSALERSLFYTYDERTEDTNKLKGKLNVKDYIVNKIPNGKADKFECSFSVFELDNSLNRIIKYVCRYLINETSKQNLKDIRFILGKLNEVSDVRCVPSDCDKVRLNKLQSHYKVILSLSKMFLINKTATYDLDNADSLCFLFPTEVLFEGFIGGFIQDVLHNKAKVRLQASEVSVFSDVLYKGHSLGKTIRMKHDILVEHETKGLFILDTKYKKVRRFDGSGDVRAIVNEEIKSSDIYQVLTYARARDSQDVYLLYPLFRFEDVEPDNPIGISTKEDGSEPINVHLISLPFIFEDDIEKTKAKLKSVIEGIFE